MQLTVNGIVLRNHKAGEDRILHILTPQQGVLTAYANKANQLRSKLSSATELLCYSNFVLFHYRDRYVVDKSDPNHLFFGLRGDFDKLCLASYFAQLALELCPRGEPAEEPLRLLLNTLHYLEEGNRDHRMLKALFELRLLTLTGFMPNLVACRECGSYEADYMLFHLVNGDLLCKNCCDSDHEPGAIAASPGVLAAMRHILYSQPERLFSFSLAEKSLDRLARLSERYLLAQVDKGFSALDLYHQSTSG